MSWKSFIVGRNTSIDSLHRSAVRFTHQVERFSFRQPQQGGLRDVAIEAHSVTPHDSALITAGGGRLPTVPPVEGYKLKMLKKELDRELDSKETFSTLVENGDVGIVIGIVGGKMDEPDEQVLSVSQQDGKAMQRAAFGASEASGASGNLTRTMPPSHTNPLFPPLPLYGPPSALRQIQCWTFRLSSFILSASFLGVVVLGSLYTSISPACRRLWWRLTLRNPDATRPFYQEEMRRKTIRAEQDARWKLRSSGADRNKKQGDGADKDGFVPTEGGPDPVVCDVAYYARRVGLDMEEFQVQTEDGFIIDLWHIYNPREYRPLPQRDRSHRGPDSFTPNRKARQDGTGKRRFPVLLMHGLLQSSGAYCVNDDASLAFMLCKSGYDVWLGNNRCGFRPTHVLLQSSDPRMWCWNIRHMAVFDLAALTSRVIYETGFEKIALVCHSQGTTQTFVALAKEQRPDLGDKLTVFCALAPAAYAGPLIGKMYFRFMRLITPSMFRLLFGIHAFIPIMMTMHRHLHARIWGWMGYQVFSFLFNWSDSRWDRGLRDRMFRFAPVYVSAESMRWWLGRECFAKNKCILATKEEWGPEDREDCEDEKRHDHRTLEDSKHELISNAGVGKSQPVVDIKHQFKHRKPRGATAWYDKRVPPFALWVCGNDDLVDGHKLLRRFDQGREPHVRIVHKKVIKEYEHLDVIWAMDAPEKVFDEIVQVLWKTCDVRGECVVPRGCENVEAWTPDIKRQGDGTDDETQSGSSSEK